MAGSQTGECKENVLNEERILAANELFSLKEQVLRDLLQMADAFSQSETARALAERFHTVFFHSGVTTGEAEELWKREGAALGRQQAGMAALLILSGAEGLEEFYRKKKIPLQILRDSLKDLSIWMDDYSEKTGETGLSLVYWLLHTMRGDVFRVGRLQYECRPLSENIVAATRRSDGHTVLFFHDPVDLREDGQVNGTNGITTENPLKSSFVEDEHYITGTPVHPGGYALGKTIRLSKEEWEIKARPGEGSLEMHIPKDGRLDLALCRESLLLASGFFSKHFPERPFTIVNCCTWFFDAQYQKLLPADSNIVKFQREFYLYPVLSDEKFCYERVFGNPDTDITTAPEDSSLRRIVKQYVLSGGKMRYNGGLLLLQHLSRFGCAFYQNDCARTVESI